jgi:hypothetical protein
MHGSHPDRLPERVCGQPLRLEDAHGAADKIRNPDVTAVEGHANGSAAHGDGVHHTGAGCVADLADGAACLV